MSYDRRLSPAEKNQLKEILDLLKQIKDGPKENTDQCRERWKFNLALANSNLAKFVLNQILRDIP